MHGKTRTTLIAIGLAFLLTTGCAYGGDPAFWTNEVTEELTIETDGLARLEARTHNGSITYTGRNNDETTAKLVVTKKGGGQTLDDAKDALDAIEVVVESPAGDAKRIAWKWKTPKKQSWVARVSYRIEAPARLGPDLETHNGPINVSGIQADAKVASHNGAVEVDSCQGRLDVETHNGRIKTESSGGSLRACTHNGKIITTFTGKEAKLTSRNGRIEADLSQCGSFSGDIQSHNGSIQLVVGNEFSADATCITHNGSIKCDVPWQVTEMSRRRLTGRFGNGGTALGVTTHNGSIRINAANRL